MGSTGPIRHAHPPGFRILYASQTPRCGSGQYSIEPAEVYLSNLSVGRGMSSASPSMKVTPWRSGLALALAIWCGDCFLFFFWGGGGGGERQRKRQRKRKRKRKEEEEEEEEEERVR